VKSLLRFLTPVFAIDLRTLGLFRACLGAVIFADLCMRLVDLRVFYTDGGVMARDWTMAGNGLWRLSLHLINGETWFAALLFIAEMLAALALMLGWRARGAAFIAFVLQGSLLNRDPLVLLGGDILINCLLFWAMFLPIGARWSVDAALSQKPLTEKQHLSWAGAGLLLQVLSVYFFSALLKTGREWWPEGTAVDYALQIDQYTTTLGSWLRGFPTLTRGLSWYVWWLELLAPPIALSPVFTRPLRFIVMVLLMTMHIGFLFCLKLGPFPFMSLTSLTVLAGGWLWDLADRWVQRAEKQVGPQPLRIFYDRDCGFCLKSVLLMRSFLILPRVQIAPAQDHPRADALMQANYSWVVIDHDDRAHLKWPAFVALLRRSPLLAWLGWLLATGSLRGGWAVRPGNAVYDFVGRHRAGFGRVSSALLPFHERPFTGRNWQPAIFGAFFIGVSSGVLLSNLLSPVTAMIFGFVLVIALLLGWWLLLRPVAGLTSSLLAAALVASFLAWNFCSVRWLPNSLYAALTPPFRLLRVDQLWDMFAPFPAKEDGWFVIPAQLAGGREVDLLHPDRAAVSYDKPAHVADEFPNIRWHKYEERLWSAQFASNRLYYGRWLCRTWNDAHAGAEQLRTFRIVYMLEMSVPQGQTSALEQRVIWRHDCFGSTAAASTDSGH
jgi:hypothetical protein